LEREWPQVLLPTAQINTLEAERRELRRTSEEPVMAQVRQLNTRRGIGTNSAWLYVVEFFAWREFRNRKQVGALPALLAPERGAFRHSGGFQMNGFGQLVLRLFWWLGMIAAAVRSVDRAAGGRRITQAFDISKSLRIVEFGAGVSGFMVSG
jgi:hypothetical protein